MSGEATTQIPAAATPEWIEWPESVCRACFLVCLLNLCVFTISWRKLEAQCSPCARATWWEAKQVSVWVSPLATRWAAEVFWTEKDGWEGIHPRLICEFCSESCWLPQWIYFCDPAGFRNFFKLWMQDFYRLHCVEVFSCSVSIYHLAVFPPFMSCFGCILASGWASSACTGSLCSGRTGCSTRSQQKSPVPFP